MSASSTTQAPALPFLHVGAQYWLENSLHSPTFHEDTQRLVPFAICCIIAGSLIILHDLYINRYKINLVRSLVVIAAIGCLSGGILVVVGSHYSDLWHHVFIIDFGVSIWSLFLVKSVDNFIFVLGYKYVNKNVSKWVYAGFFVFIFLTIFASWTIGIPFFPFICDMNSNEFHSYLYEPFFGLYTAAGTLCNFFFSYYFVKVLFQVNFLKRIKIPKQSQLFAIRCVLHGLASTIPIIYAPFADNLPQENLISAFVIAISLHLLFNYKIERFLLTDNFRILSLKLRQKLRRGEKYATVKKVRVAPTASNT